MWSSFGKLPGKISTWGLLEMDIHGLRSFIAERGSISVLETVDVHTRAGSGPKAFDYVIEACPGYFAHPPMK